MFFIANEALLRTLATDEDVLNDRLTLAVNIAEKMPGFELDAPGIFRFCIGWLSSYTELLNLQVVSRFIGDHIKDVTFMAQIWNGAFYRHVTRSSYQLKLSDIKVCEETTWLFRQGPASVLRHYNKLVDQGDNLALEIADDGDVLHLPHEVKTDAATFNSLTVIQNPEGRLSLHRQMHTNNKNIKW